MDGIAVGDGETGRGGMPVIAAALAAFLLGLAVGSVAVGTWRSAAVPTAPAPDGEPRATGVLPLRRVPAETEGQTIYLVGSAAAATALRGAWDEADAHRATLASGPHRASILVEERALADLIMRDLALHDREGVVRFIDLRGAEPGGLDGIPE